MTTAATSPVPPEQDPSSDLAADSTVPATDAPHDAGAAVPPPVDPILPPPVDPIVPPPPAGATPPPPPEGTAFPPPPAGAPTYSSAPGPGHYPPPAGQGTTVGTAGVASTGQSSGSMPWQAPRPRQGRMIAGVCAGLARRYNLSPIAVRLLFVLSTVLPGPQFIAYIVLWALMPEE
jgi:phage shock protein PspC (stress-responsive transcriptional regulator)